MTTHPTTADTTSDVTRWTRLHILLHWIVLGLVVLQFATGGWMSEAFRATLAEEDGGAAAAALAPLHMAVGLAVFLAIAARVWDRIAHGRPSHPPGEPVWAQWLARVTQTLLYVVVLAMPIAGLVAWFAENAALGSLHALAAKLLVALVALHAAGALANHYWFKTDVLRKMLPGHGREEAPPRGVATAPGEASARR